MDSKWVSSITTTTLRATMRVRRHVVIPLVALAALAGASAAQAALRADFNADGYEDLAIGVPYESISGDINAGAVHVIYGHPTGLTALSNQLWFQDLSGIVRELSEPGDQFGGALAAGDFNGDGFADLAIGAPGEHLGANNSINKAGVVHILYGSPTGLTDVNDQVWDQDSPGVFGVPATYAYFGSAFAAGDFNKDGRTDLAIGVRGQEVADAFAGGVLILHGSVTGLTSTGSNFLTANVLLSFGQSKDFDSFGESLTSADFNVDGFADLAIGEPGEDVQPNSGPAVVDAGQVLVVYGSANGLNSETSPRLQSVRQGAGFFQGAAETSDGLGSTLAAGDFNNDGRDDLAVGVPSEDVGNIYNAGAVNVIYGSSSGLSVVGNQLWYQDVAGIADASEANDSFGRALTVGDFNGDGFDDLAVGVPHEDFPGVISGDVDTSAGAVNVIYGTIQGLTAASNQLWDQNKQNIEDTREDLDNFGATLTAGDFDNDGRDDLAVGVPSEDIGSVVDAGAINVIYGTARTGLNAGGIFPGEQTDQLWHQNVSGIADASEANDRLGAALASLPSTSLWGAGLTGQSFTIAQTCRPNCRLQGQLGLSNVGTMAAPASIVRFFLSTDEILDDSDTLLDEAHVPSLRAAGSAAVNVTLPLVPGQNAQGLFVIAVLDATDAVPQVNEKNNIIVSPVIQ